MQHIKDSITSDGNEVIKVGRCQNLKGLVLHDKEFGFKYKGNGKPLMSCDQRRDVI